MKYLLSREEVRYERFKKLPEDILMKRPKQMIENSKKKKSLNLWQAISLIIQVI